jgi:hypothetical protein
MPHAIKHDSRARHDREQVARVREQQSPRIACMGRPGDVNRQIKREEPKMATNFDLLVLGSGSAAFAAALTAQELSKTAVMTEERSISDERSVNGR